MAFYQKYRPRTLTELVGQGFVRQTLQIALQNNQVSHAYLFFGSRGTGKTSAARILAKALNCKNPTETGNPCNECDFCAASDSGSFVDLIEIDGASNRKIEHARALIEKIHFAPTLGKKKVYIIDEVHMLTKEAFNALLKTIEEPPDHAYFLLATTELQKVPDTIRSRCQVFTFHRFTPEQIAGRLQEIADKEGIVVSHKDALLLIGKKSMGGLRDAIGLFEQASATGEVSVEHLQQELGIASVSQMEDFFEFLSLGETAKAIEFIGEISSEGLSLDDFLEQFLGILREKMLRFSTFEENPEKLRFVLELIEHFDAARRSLRDAPIPTLPIEIAIVRATKIESVNPISEKTSGGFHIFGKKQKKEVESQKNSEKSGASKTDNSLKEKPMREEQQEKENPKAEIEVVPLSEESLKTHWGKVLERLEDVVLRAALSQGIASAKDTKTILLLFPAESWKKQAEEAKRFAKLESVVREIFGPQINMVMEVQSIILQPVEKPLSSGMSDDIPVTDPAVISEIFGTKTTAI